MRRPVASSSGVPPRGSKVSCVSGTTSAMGTASATTSSGVVAVELHEGHAGVGAVGLLVGQQPVEPGHDLLGHGGHRPGPVEQDVEVDMGNGRAHESSFSGKWMAHRRLRPPPARCCGEYARRGVTQKSSSEPGRETSDYRSIRCLGRCGERTARPPTWRGRRPARRRGAAADPALGRVVPQHAAARPRREARRSPAPSPRARAAARRPGRTPRPTPRSGSQPPAARTARHRRSAPSARRRRGALRGRRWRRRTAAWRGRARRCAGAGRCPGARCRAGSRCRARGPSARRGASVASVAGLSGAATHGRGRFGSQARKASTSARRAARQRANTSAGAARSSCTQPSTMSSTDVVRVRHRSSSAGVSGADHDPLVALGQVEHDVDDGPPRRGRW